ncbi:MAG: ribonuclease [Thiomonas sp.]|nr:ribonuclease [Thiomonas sp.]
MNRRCIRSTLRSLLLTGLLLATLPFGAHGWMSLEWPALPSAQAREVSGQAAESSAIRFVAAADLPVQARDVLRRIEQGGPFKYEKDGTVFGNYERLLPSKRRGFYREYTVPTPGARNRGARRIVCGGVKHHPEVCYYTDDHYASFRRIAK